ncbi:MAG: hypothetical protein ACRC5C_13125 [Bacilli bacterium]
MMIDVMEFVLKVIWKLFIKAWKMGQEETFGPDEDAPKYKKIRVEDATNTFIVLRFLTQSIKFVLMWIFFPGFGYHQQRAGVQSIKALYYLYKNNKKD